MYPIESNRYAQPTTTVHHSGDKGEHLPCISEGLTLLNMSVAFGEKLFRVVASLVTFLIFSVALWTLYLELGRYPTEQILAAATAIAPRKLLLALGLLVASFLMTVVSETLSARYGDLRLSPGRAAAAAVIAAGIGNRVSFGLLRSGALRYRLYGSWGVSGVNTTKILAFSAASYRLGYATVAGVGLLLMPSGALPLPEGGGIALPLLGGLLLLAAPAYLLLAILFPLGIRTRATHLRPPKPKLALAQVVSAGAEWLAGATIVFVLLPANSGASYGLYLGAFALAKIVGTLSQIPGGIGVFDSALLVLLSPLYSVPVIAGALILYRVIYFVLPLVFGLGLLLIRELLYEQSRLRAAAHRFGSRVASVLPSAMTLALFLSGMLLLFSGATPSGSERMRILQTLIPLSVVELSHLLASVIGIFLLFHARGLQRRLHVAYSASVVLIISAILLSLTKGANYEEAIILSVVLGLIIPTRRYFYRPSRLFGSPLSTRWIRAIVLVLMVTAWLTIFSNRPVSLNRYLILQVTPEGDAARSLRALGGVIAVAAILLILRAVLCRLQAPPGGPIAESPMVRRIVTESSAGYANLALMNDKRFFLNQEQDAFIMYTPSGKSWIAMGDPVGPRSRWPELIWRFREECDRESSRPLFYEVSGESLPLYSELGLGPLALGAEARVKLKAFSTQGQDNHELRNAVNHMVREGWEVAVISPEESEELYPKLRSVSDAWLASKKTREQGFARGAFEPAYLRNFPLALVRRGDEVIAFANLWETNDREEASVDLMRHRPEAPSETMDFLFVTLLERARDRGFSWFNLGLAPLWHRLAGILYRHGDQFDSFQGVRAYKEKFSPTWETKYLALPSGVSLPGALLDLTRLAGSARINGEGNVVDR